MAERFVGCQIWKRHDPLDSVPIKNREMQAVAQAGFLLWVISGDCRETFCQIFSYQLHNKVSQVQLNRVTLEWRISALICTVLCVTNIGKYFYM